MLAGIQRTCKDLVNVQQTTNQVNSGGRTAISTNTNSAVTPLTSLSALNAPFPSVQSAIQSTSDQTASGQSGHSLISNPASNFVIPSQAARGRQRQR
jgi:hypothetical protein